MNTPAMFLDFSLSVQACVLRPLFSMTTVRHNLHTLYVGKVGNAFPWTRFFLGGVCLVLSWEETGRLT